MLFKKKNTLKPRTPPPPTQLTVLPELSAQLARHLPAADPTEGCFGHRKMRGIYQGNTSRNVGFFEGPMFFFIDLLAQKMVVSNN